MLIRGYFVSKLDDKKRNEIKDLVLAQKKAKISWVATICQVSEEDLRLNAEDMGLLIEDDFILQPSESKKQKTVELLQAKREQIITEIVDKRMYRYNPENRNPIAFGILRSFTDTITIRGLLVKAIADDLAKLRTVTHTFDNQVIKCQSSEERPYIESMRNQLRKQQDESLRLHISLKKYIEFLVLPKIENKLSKMQKIELVNKVTNEDNRMRTEAIQLTYSSIVDQKTKGKRVKEITARLPAGQLQTVPANQIQQFLNYLKELYHFEIRKKFFENPNFLADYLLFLS